MIIRSTKYIFEDYLEYEDFLNEIFVGLSKYKKEHKDFSFKINQLEDNTVEVKTFSLNESVN